ncbi:site-specific integrase [Ferruginibacter albus]|uniref:site-specific integrase n=1 Tax=Ferruginibacter albus TaxID=2875540 RepID=UPI001CC33BA1|nr:site-specific integrase [Ferruginibacter albus]UAY53209.1 site-specific integrase [Ferruginibacter albus]
MKTNITIAMDFRRKKKDGTYPLVLHLGHNRSSTTIPLNISIKETDWDDDNKVIKKSYKGTDSVDRLNNMLQKKRSDAMDIIFKLTEAGILQNLSKVEIRNRIEKENSSGSFFDFAKQVIKDLIGAGRLGTARSFKGVVAILKTFNNEKDLAFKDITHNFLTRLENKHLAKGHSYNGLAVYMRSIRSIFNKAVNAGVIDKDPYPFQNYKIKTVPTQKRALDVDLLQTIITKRIPKTVSCFHARNYFVASYMMYGMNFSDMAHLKKSDIINGRIQYRRKKTSKLYDIKITPSLDKILQYYISQSGDRPYVFPIIKRDTALLQDKDVEWARKRYNIQLKEVAKLCKIEQNLTSYVSRHSFATQAMLLEVPLIAVSTMLGHSSLKTTEIYLKSLPNNILDDYNAKILGKKKPKK